MQQTILRLIGITLLLLAPFHKTFAWGADGHRLICALAEEQLSPAAKTMLSEMLQMGEFLDGNASEDFPEACLWADKSRYTTHKTTYEQHFINVPRVANSIDFSRDCEALNCVASAIQQNLVYLSRDAKGKREKARQAAALRFLAHFVADLHQPLHVGNGEDWGGNKIKVRWYDKESNLHGVWDYEILKKAGISYPASLEYLRSVQPETRAYNVLTWIRTSFRIARDSVYKDVSGEHIKSGDRLGDAYFERSKPIAINQLSLAAKRLAYLLNELAIGKLETNILID